MKTTFVVLSDIHFRREFVGGTYDVDRDVRTRLVADVQALREAVGPITAILVNGDIAFRAAKEEYGFAREWFKQLCDAAECPHEQIWTVPGNHDVNRSTISADPALRDVRGRLRSAPVDEIDGIIQQWLTSRHQDLLFEPITEYNDFAAPYECHISATNPYWTRTVPLNDGSSLRVLGLNSTLASDSWDDEAHDETKLVLGTIQATAANPEPGVAYLSLCHHPVGWLRDRDRVQWVMARRNLVQIYGHIHDQRAFDFDGSLVISSGAMHPDRAEPGWRPTYNVVSFSVDGVGDHRELVIELRARIWNRDSYFTADYEAGGSEVQEFRRRLAPWTAPHREPEVSAPEVEPGTATRPSDADVAAGPRRSTVDPKRRLAYRFLVLPHHERVRIATKLELVRDEDEGVRDRDLFGLYFRRAAENARLSDLWREVELRHRDGAPDPNPFEVSGG